MRSGDERGAVALEVVVVVPVVVLVLGLFLAGWRLWSARTVVGDAAASAARAATLESSASSAHERAAGVAAQNLAAAGVTCQQSGVDVDTAGFARPPGEPAEVTVAVNCTVALDDLLLPGLPGEWRVSARRSQAMDTFRERRP